MFYLYTLPLARPAQAKIQMLTTRWRVMRSNLLSLIKFSRLYPIFLKNNFEVGYPVLYETRCTLYNYQLSIMKEIRYLLIVPFLSSFSGFLNLSVLTTNNCIRVKLPTSVSPKINGLYS